jgi:hypothetical protein
MLGGLGTQRRLKVLMMEASNEVEVVRATDDGDSNEAEVVKIIDDGDSNEAKVMKAIVDEASNDGDIAKDEGRDGIPVETLGK